MCLRAIGETEFSPISETIANYSARDHRHRASVVTMYRSSALFPDIGTE